ncbi:MAG TPA: methyltransferase domain-containing protein [Bacteroidia bacterium]|nr:methyltransferase domain-containing protein [Bacteroidia bacterium]
MKYLNLGCGTHYDSGSEWTNLDFVSSGPGVIAHNLLSGVPFQDNSFDLVYHSHVLEHFSKSDGEKLIDECFRVLKPGGTLRIAIPDLEQIAKNYLKYLEIGIDKPNDELIRANYNWMLIEMYDQTVRNNSGGNMAAYIYQDKIVNEDFMYERIGEEGRALRQGYLNNKSKNDVSSINKGQNIFNRIKNSINYRFRKFLLKQLNINEKALKIGEFRLGGEIHQWMYDRYSLSNLLTRKGGQNIAIRTAFTSNIPHWESYGIDGKEGKVRKPDSLFIEAIKK